MRVFFLPASAREAKLTYGMSIDIMHIAWYKCVLDADLLKGEADMPRRGQGWQRRGCSRRAVRLLKPSLLLLLHHGPAHGYTLIDQLEAYGLGDVNTSVVYRVLRDMEERQWVASSWDDERTKGPPRRVYRLTALGDEVLRWWTSDLRETRRMIDRILKTHTDHMEEGEGAYH